MTYVADLHLHSRFAMGTSRDLTFESLSKWASVKGIDLLASADFTHPVWFDEMRRSLKESGDGLYEFNGVRFVLGTEVSCVAPQGGANRRVHLLLFAPSLDVVAGINTALASKGNLKGDGRPSLAMTPRDLLSTALEIDPRCLVIPAHAWTPWFGVYGSKSGFDSLEECFGADVKHIYAIETGLSSDPGMNWRLPELDRRSLVSFSDAHSAPKLGRELTVFDGKLSYDGLAAALKHQGIAYTVEFYPQEGKYHYSGHRKCGVSYSPDGVARNGRRCPVCGRPLTLGVMQRVEELSARDVETWIDDEGFVTAGNGRPRYRNLVSLQQTVAASLGVGPNTKRVRGECEALVAHFGSELATLMDAPTAEIEAVSGERVAQGIDRMRRGDIQIVPGYDGLYGTVNVWPDDAGQAAGRPRTRRASYADAVRGQPNYHRSASERGLAAR